MLLHVFVPLLAVLVSVGGNNDMSGWLPHSVALMMESGEIDLQTQPKAFFTQCTSQRLAGCHHKFNDALGIDSMHDWRNPAVLQYAISKVMNTGTDGYAEVCKARQVYQGCLGGQYRSCLDPLYYLQRGFSANASFEYLSIMIGLEFSCVEGLTVGIRDWPCIVATTITQQPAITACMKSYEAAIGQGTNICVASTTYTQCVAAIMRRGCPPGYQGEAAWYSCEKLQRALLVDMRCNIPCSLS